MAVQQGKAGGRCLKTKLTHFRLMKEKHHQSSPPLAPQFQGGEASFKPENNGATLTFPSFLLAKVKDLVEVSTLGKALNKKPHANKASPCAFKCHIHTLPNIHHSCLLAAPGILSLAVQIPDQRQWHGHAGMEGHFQCWSVRSPHVVGQISRLSFPFQRPPFVPITPCLSCLAQGPGQQAEIETPQTTSEQNQKDRLKHD